MEYGDINRALTDEVEKLRGAIRPFTLDSIVVQAQEDGDDYGQCFFCGNEPDGKEDGHKSTCAVELARRSYGRYPEQTKTRGEMIRAAHEGIGFKRGG